MLKINFSAFAVLMVVTMPLNAGLSTRNISDDYQLGDHKGKGVVVYSITENCPSTLTIKIRGVSNRYKLDLALDQGKKGKLDWQYPCGRLLILKFKEGEYEIYSYVAYEDIKKGRVSKAFSAPTGSSDSITIEDEYNRGGLVIPKNYFSKKFKIVAGKVSYGGSLHINRNIESKTTTITSVDNKNRDLKLLYKKMPHFQPENILK